MRNTHIILVAFLLFNCADNNIAPKPPDQDAASARENFYTFSAKKEKSYALNLKEANFYLYSDYFYTDNSQRIEFKELNITDGVLQYFPDCNCNHFVDLPSPMPDGTRSYGFLIQVVLFSAPDQPLQSGDFLMDKRWDYSGIWPVSSVPWVQFFTYDHEDSRYSDLGDPTLTSSNLMQARPGYVIKDEYLNIKGNIEDGEQITITFTNKEMMMFPYLDLLDGLSSSTFGMASFNFTGIIDGSMVWPEHAYGRRISSNQDHVAMIMKRFNKHK